VPDSASLENDLLKLDLSLDPDAQVRLFHKPSGAQWSCPGPPFVLRYWDAPHLGSRTCPADHAHGWEFRLIPQEERVELHCAWPRAASGFRAVFHLDGPTLALLFPGRRMIENQPFDVRNMALDVLAGFGGVPTGRPGFLLIPRGLGVLCRFDKTEEHETPLLVYANGGRGITAPVFGLARDDAALLGNVCQGEFETELVVTANGGPDRNLNCVHPRFRLRFHPSDPLQDIDHRVEYTFLAREDAGWAGMAKAYRRYLLDTCGHPSLAARIEQRPLLDYARRAPTVHVQLAEKRRKTRMTGDGELIVRTSFAEATRLAESVRDAGIEHAVIVLAGWNCEGLDGLYPTRFPVESAVGGADAMSQSLNAIRSFGFQVGALDNYTDMYRRSPAFDADLVCRQAGGEAWRGGIWAGGHAYVICPRQARERHAQRDLRRLRDLGLEEGLLFLDHFPGPGVLRCYHPDHPLFRSEYAQALRELIQMAQGTFGLCRVSGPEVFTALIADSCVCPVEKPATLDQLEPEWYADEDVAFLPVALHGVVLPAADAGADALRVAEFGAVPVYHVTAGDLTTALPGMLEFSRRYEAELAPLAADFIEAHVSPGEGLIRVAYAGGAEVLINRTAEPARIDGAEVPPENFRVQR
jgi:hypothetical protein